MKHGETIRERERERERENSKTLQGLQFRVREGGGVGGGGGRGERDCPCKSSTPQVTRHRLRRVRSLHSFTGSQKCFCRGVCVFFLLKRKQLDIFSCSVCGTHSSPLPHYPIHHLRACGFYTALKRHRWEFMPLLCFYFSKAYKSQFPSQDKPLSSACLPLCENSCILYSITRHLAVCFMGDALCSEWRRRRPCELRRICCSRHSCRAEFR